MTRSSSNPLPVRTDEPVNDAADKAVALVRSQAPLRRVLAGIAGRVVAGAAWERFGFVRLADYAREHVGVSARQLQELSHTDEALRRLPQVERALVSGELPWTKARLIVRVATAADEEHWLAVARKLSARALSREVRKVDQRLQHGCGHGGPRPPKLGSPPPMSVSESENLLLSLSIDARSSWYRARQFAWRAACRRLKPWECADAVLGEVLSGMDLDLELPGSVWHESAGIGDWLGSASSSNDAAPLASPAVGADGCASQAIGAATGRDAGPPDSWPLPADGCAAQGLGDGADAAPSPLGSWPLSADGCAAQELGVEAPAASATRRPSAAEAGADASSAAPDDPIADTPPPNLLPPFLRDLALGLDDADPFELDARLRRAVKLEQSFHARLGPLLLEVSRARLYRRYGCLRMDDFAREHLGMSPRSVQALLRVERAAARCEPLGDAYREGRLSSEQAMALVPIAYEEGAEGQQAAWVEHAQRVTVKQLADDVDRAQTTQIFDPTVFTTRESWDSAYPRDDPQTGAQPMDVGRGDSGRGDSGAKHRLMIHGPRDVIRLFRATLAAVQRAIERQEDRTSDESEAFHAMLEHALATWREMEALHSRRYPVEKRDDWQCTVPGCTSYGNLHDHHIRFRSAGGSDALSNRTTLCIAHHQRGVHAGRIRCQGTAPDSLRFELGLREGHPPLITYEAPAAPEPRP